MTAAIKSLAIWRTTRWLLALRDWGARCGVPGSAAFRAFAKALAPYTLILILPGGSVMALLLWLYRRRKNAARSGSLAKDMLPAQITGRAPAIQT